MAPRGQLKDLLAGKTDCPPLVDLGTTTLTGIRSGAIHRFTGKRLLGHPAFQTLALEPDHSRSLNSDFIRAGFIYKEQEMEQDSFQDDFGLNWIREGQNMVPVCHPLEQAGLEEIRHFPRPGLTRLIQQNDLRQTGDSLVIADAPAPGLLNLSFALRGSWTFMEDVLEKPEAVHALMAWSLESITQAYQYLLVSLGRQPDVLVYADDLGYGGGMYLSPLEFRTYLLPYLAQLITRLRGLTKAAICFHSCGSVSSLLPDIAGLGIEIFNLDLQARDMSAEQVRKLLPPSAILHGSHDLCALGRAVRNEDKAQIARLLTEFAQGLPVIAAPCDSISTEEELVAAEWGADFIKKFTGADWKLLRRIGPVRNVIESALAMTRRDKANGERANKGGISIAT